MKGRLFIFLIGLIFFSAINAKTIQVGVRSYYPPFEIIIDQNNQFSGFDVNLMTEICKRIQLECIFQPFPLNALFDNILEDKIHLAIGALILTPQRQENFAFSLPYLMSKGQFVTLNSNKINNIIDVCDRKIGIITGSIYQFVAEKQCNKPLKFVQYINTSDVYVALEKNKIAAFITDQEAAKYWVANNAEFKLLGPSLPTGTGYAIMTNKKNTPLIQQINQALLNMENDGTYLKIYSIYFQ